MATKKITTEEPSGYAEAMREVETILGELDSNNVDVDVLATKVRRASYLITWCNERIAADRKSTRLNSSHRSLSRMPSSA